MSTDKQGVSGLGLEAQKAAVEKYVSGVSGVIVSEFVEIESGKRNDRPQLKEALRLAKVTRATLVIAKLDRLSRNLAFIAALQESGARFVAADMPEANETMIQFLAVIAQYERKAISARTKAALQAAKARGTKLGNPRLKVGDRASAIAAARVRSRRARAKARDILPYIAAARSAGCKTLIEIAEALTARGIRTASGCSNWGPEQVRRVITHAKKMGLE